MRLPTFKVYRAFSSLDHASDDECESYIRRVKANYSPSREIFPWAMFAAALLAWPTFWITAPLWFNLSAYVPIPKSLDANIILLAVSSVYIACISGLLARDGSLYFALKAELGRTNCRRCGQSLLGVPITTIGAEPDPANNFIRCPECGKKYCLLEIGLTPRELVPLEKRHVDPNVGKRRASSPKW